MFLTVQKSKAEKIIVKISPSPLLKKPSTTK